MVPRRRRRGWMVCVCFAATILVTSGLRRRQGVLLSIINKSTTTTPSSIDYYDHHDHGRRLRTMLLSLRGGGDTNAAADGSTTKTNIVYLRSIAEMQAVIDQSGRNRPCSSHNNSNGEEDNSNSDEMNTNEIRSRQGVDNDKEVVDQLVVVYFSSTNCPPCQKVSPLFTELAEEFDPTTHTQDTDPNPKDREKILSSPQRKQIVFCKVTVEEDASSATADIATTYDVTGYPTFLFFKNGEKIMEIVGGNLAEATLYDWINLLLASSSSSSSKKSSKTDDATSEF